MEKETITIPKAEYERLRRQASIDIELVEQFVASLKDIKEGRIRRVK